jgi:hypothetical protein
MKITQKGRRADGSDLRCTSKLATAEKSERDSRRDQTVFNSGGSFVSYESDRVPRVLMPVKTEVWNTFLQDMSRLNRINKFECRSQRARTCTKVPIKDVEGKQTRPRDSDQG